MWNRYFPGSTKLRSPLALALAAVLAVGAGALTALYIAAGDNTVDTDVFPEKLPVQAELHDGESLRNVEFYADGITPKHAKAFNVDGTLTDYWYRPNGTLEKAVTVRVTEDGTGIVVRQATFLADGKTYKHDVEFFDDGVRKAKENTLVDANTQHRLYYHDNGAVEKDQVIRLDKKGWKLSTESRYRADGTLAQSFVSIDEYAWERKSFNEVGVLTEMQKVGKWGADYSHTVYKPDGRTLARELTQTHTQTRLLIFGDDGKVKTETAWYGPVIRATINHTVFNQAGIRLYQLMLSPTAGEGSAMRISSATIYTPDGKEDVRRFYWDANGAMTETVYKDPQHWTRRLFRPEGTLEKEHDHVYGQREIVTREYSEADNIRADIPEYLVKVPTLETPQQIIPYVPPMYH